MVDRKTGKKARPGQKLPRTPSMEFRYSWVYDHENRLRYTDPLYPSGDTIRGYADEVSAQWKPMQRRVLGRIARLSGLPWREGSIVCYLVGRGVPLSDPLTMPVYEGQPQTFLEKMSYQLVERMVMHPGNLKAQAPFWEAMFRSMAEDGVKVSYMVPVNAIFRELQGKLFQGGTVGKSLLSTNLDYRRAWEIVDNMGHSSIIERFRERTWE